MSAKVTPLNRPERRHLSEQAEQVLADQISRVYQSIAILELVSDALTAGVEGAQETGRVMSAVDGALELLRAIPREIDSDWSISEAIERMEAGRKEAQS